MQFTNSISDLLRSVFEWVQRMIVVPNPPRPVPEIGWLGVVAIATYVGLAIASWRIAVLVCLSFLSFGVLGFWQDSLDLADRHRHLGRHHRDRSGCRWRS